MREQRGKSRAGHQLRQLLILLTIYLVAPAGLAVAIWGVTIQTAVVTTLFWLLLLVLLFRSMTNKAGEVVGWAMIFGMFTTVPAVLIITGLFRAAGLK